MIRSGITSQSPESARGTIGRRISTPERQQSEPDPDDGGRPPVAQPTSRHERDHEHAQRQRRDGQAGLQRVVLEDHLKEDRERDHRPAQADLLEGLSGDPQPEMPGAEQVRIEQRDRVLALAPDEPPGEQGERRRADDEERADRLAAFLPDEDPEHDAAHPEHREDRADDIDAAVARVRHVADRARCRRSRRR